MLLKTCFLATVLLFASFTRLRANEEDEELVNSDEDELDDEVEDDRAADGGDHVRQRRQFLPNQKPSSWISGLPKPKVNKKPRGRKHTLRCFSCVFSYNARYLNPEMFGLENDTNCVPKQNNQYGNLSLSKEDQTIIEECPSKARYCSAEILFVNEAFTGIRRGCDTYCMKGTYECQYHGFGLTKKFCRSCCNNAELCNGWGDHIFYSGKVIKQFKPDNRTHSNNASRTSGASVRPTNQPLRRLQGLKEF